MKLFLILLVIPSFCYSQEKTEFQKYVSTEIERSKQDARERQDLKASIDSTINSNKRDEELEVLKRKLNTQEQNTNLYPVSYPQNGNIETSRKTPTHADTVLQSLRPLGNFKISNDPNVVPQGFTPGKYDVTDTNRIIVDFKPSKYLEEEKNKTVLITVIISILIIAAIGLILKKSIHGSKKDQ